MRRRGCGAARMRDVIATSSQRLTTLGANTLWYLVCLPAALAFQRARRDVAGAQTRRLLDLVRRNTDTAFGRRYDFASIRSVADYQARVPLSTYDDYAAAVARIGAGQPQVLTHEAVRLLEPTSGSTASTKHIPYTAALQHEFQRGIAPWIFDLYTHNPQLLRGQAYWSVTPVTRRNEHSPGGIPIGFAEDSAYLGFFQRHLVQSVMAVPSIVQLIDDIEAFRYITLLFLLRSHTLALISVWNPTFLTLLVAHLVDWWPQLSADIAYGTLTPPRPIAADIQAQLGRLNRPDPRRATAICRAFQTGGDPGAIHTRLWPNLRLISCWTDAHAARYAADLARQFPHAAMQGKGLIATEGFVSFPLAGHTGSVLAIRSHFFEFLPIATDGEPDLSQPYLAHELNQGKRYAVVLTTAGGFYRYQLHDVIEVVDHQGDCPLMRFVGKAANVSDWFGEKVHEQHVQPALDTLLDRYAVEPTFVMVACDEAAGPPAYTLFIEVADQPDATLPEIGAELETVLRENYHYRYCRDLGQLDAVRVFRIDSDALETYLTVCQAHGQRAGDIKPVVLHRLGGWARHFRGRFLPHTVERM